jgi:hypothetical protein
VAREVVHVAAGRHDVDEAEQRRLELRVARREIHRLVVERLQRAQGGRRQRVRQPLPDREQLLLQGPLLDHGADDSGHDGP